MSVKSVSVIESYKYAFSKVAQNWLLLFGAWVTIIVISIIGTQVVGGVAMWCARNIPLIGFLFFPVYSIFIFLLQVYLMCGMLRIVLKIYGDEEVSFADLFSGLPYLKVYSVATFLYGLIVSVGLLLLIVPGVIWSIKYVFFHFLVLDKQMQAIDSLKKSSRITDGVKWKLFLFFILMYLFNIAGVCLLFVGLFFTIPMSFLALAYIYHELLNQTDNSQMPA
ncbi:MAG: hypothetical protein RBU23_09215 [Candidatus Auribacterota bacterium]|jgi:uncharacterized membrane protein|nr:hypothetical protein [Candidatus Auribacterota bacterium]